MQTFDSRDIARVNDLAEWFRSQPDSYDLRTDSELLVEVRTLIRLATTGKISVPGFEPSLHAKVRVEHCLKFILFRISVRSLLAYKEKLSVPLMRMWFHEVLDNTGNGAKTEAQTFSLLMFALEELR